MTQHTLASVRIDEDTKERADAVLSAIGLTIADAIRMTLTKIATEQQFSLDYQLNAETAAVLRAVKDGR